MRDETATDQATDHRRTHQRGGSACAALGQAHTAGQDLRLPRRDRVIGRRTVGGRQEPGEGYARHGALGAVLHVRASGKGAWAAVATLVGLVRNGFGEAMDQPGRSEPWLSSAFSVEARAGSGMAVGVVTVLSAVQRRQREAGTRRRRRWR